MTRRPLSMKFDPGRMFGRIPVGLLSCALSFLIYAQSLSFEFVYDDRMQIVNNPWLRSWHYLPRYFAAHVWGFLNGASAGRYWRPLFLVWLRLNYVLFGLTPSGWHLTTVLVHIAATASVYLLARHIGFGKFLAVAASAIFAVHPALIETAAWISGATDSPMTLCVISALLLYLKAKHSLQGRKVFVVASLACYGAALLFKETGVVAPGLVFVLALFYRGHRDDSVRQRIRSALGDSFPYVLATCVYLVVRITIMRTLYAGGHIAFREVLLTWPSLLLFYLRQLVLPIGLSPCYEFKPLHSISVTGFWLPLAGVVAIGAGLFWWTLHLPERSAIEQREVTREQAYLAIALLILPLLPALYIRGLNPQDLVHTRYLYMPCIGFSLLLAAGLSTLKLGRVQWFGRPGMQTVALVALIGLLAAGNFVQQRHWSDDLALFTRAAGLSPGNSTALSGLAIELEHRGRYEEALQLFKRALAEDPEFWTYRNIGGVYLLMGKYDRAVEYFRRAVELNPASPDSYDLLAAAEINQGKLDDAQGSIERAIKLYPEGDGYHYTLGFILEQRGDRQGAIREFEAELKANRHNPDAELHLRALLQGSR